MYTIKYVFIIIEEGIMLTTGISIALHDTKPYIEKCHIITYIQFQVTYTPALLMLKATSRKHRA